MSLQAPVIKGIEQNAGYHPAYIASGAYRSMSYQDWREQAARQAGLDGEPFRAPKRRPDGSVEDVSHAAESREEIVERFLMSAQELFAAGTSAEDREKARAAAELKEAMGGLGDLAKRAAAGDGEALHEAVKRSMMAMRATDPAILPQPYVSPTDFLAEFAVPLDTTELITLCDETGLYRALPEVVNGANTDSWRELNELEFVSGCNDIAFEPGGCPEEFRHDGDNRSVAKRHIGAKKTLSQSDIEHSIASIGAGYGIRQLIGGFNDNGLPGEADVATLLRGNITSLKEKEAQLASILVLNGWDELLVKGSNSGNTEEFDGLATIITAANGARCNSSVTGTFDVNHFDQFLAAGCAKPQAIIGHPTALAQLALAYFGIGSQTIFYDRNQNVVPGIHFASELMTGIGPIALIGDSRFVRTDGPGDTFDATLYPVRRRQNGEPLIYKATQIPLSYKDLVPGCTAVSFELFAVTALVIKAMCAQACYRARFEGLVDDGCDYIHPCTT